MTSPRTLAGRVPAMLLHSLVGLGAASLLAAAHAQTAAGAAATARSKADATVTLDPFEVVTSADTSYGALNSNSITRFNTELDKVPLSADIYTQAFMQDVDVTSIDALLTNYGGAQMNFGNPAGQVNLNQPGDRNTTTGFVYRGIPTGAIRVNGFVTEPSNFVSTTNFDIERVELIHGPQGLLYGPGGAGATVVATTLQAKFNNTSGNLSERMDQYGSQRAILRANAGNDWVAGTVALLNEDDRYRRLFFGSDDRGYYGQLAFHLPLHTTLRIDDSYTYQNLINSAGTTGVSFGGVNNDPRNGLQLSYLEFTGQTGAINPATGQAYSKYGAIDNGNLSWLNLYSFPGLANWEIAENYNVDVIADTVWTPWLSTNIGFNYNRLVDWFGGGIGANLSAPLQNGNPLNNWAMNSTPSESMNNRRHKNFRASALVTKNFFDEKVKTQTTVGYDFQRQGTGGTAYNYYLSDAQGNLILTPGGTNLGRVAAPQQWWGVDNGPTLRPVNYIGQGASIYQNPANGNYYTKMLTNPRSPQYITPLNPLGLYSLATSPTGALLYPGVTGQDLPGYEKEVTSTGIFLANYTGWWNDFINTMVGYRYTYSANHIPSGASSTVVQGPVDTSKFGAPSYNLGIDGRILPWLRWYYGYSANYNVGNSETDFYGRPIDTSYGKGQEYGFKFTPFDSRISGSIDYYINRNTHVALTPGSGLMAQVNPSSALNGQYDGSAGAGNMVPEDYISKGLELSLNANLTKNWRMHLSATYSNGTVESSSVYGILYNDQFHTDGKGGVTYANGSPVIVPVTPGTSISSLSSNTDPTAKILVGVPTQQLTTAMMGDPSSPYYAWQGTTVTTNGQIAPSSYVYKVLKWFNPPGAGTAYTGATGLPISAIQYAWPDPANTHGSVIVTQAGQDTVSYPKYQITLVNTYQLSTGFAKGLGAALALVGQWDWRNFYYSTPTSGNPLLWKQAPPGVMVNLHPFYEHKFGRVLWRTQLDIDNLFNHYHVELTPTATTGFTTPTGVGVRWDQQPRSYAWSNTFSF